jgi:hypothetical protein
MRRCLELIIADFNPVIAQKQQEASRGGCQGFNIRIFVTVTGLFYAVA